MKTIAPFRLQPELAAPRPLRDRGKILYAEDIRALYGRRPDGHRWRKSLKWVWANFAPEFRHKDGRTPWWWEADALRWMDDHRESAA